jgi:hypothetical protein
MPYGPVKPVQIVKGRPKSGGEWTYSDLDHYRIRINYEDADTFFAPISASPASLIPSDFLTCLDAEDVIQGDERAYTFIQYLDTAMSPPPGDESAVNDFIVNLLLTLGFAPKGTMIRTKKNFPLGMGGEIRYAQADACILDGVNPLLLIQEDRSRVDPLTDPIPSLIAAAIAAFDVAYKHGLRIRPPFTPILGITLCGSWPTFFKIPVSPGFVNAVACDGFRNVVVPNEVLCVSAHSPRVARPFKRLEEGMKPLDNRFIVLSALMRFKHLMFHLSGKCQ